MAGLDRLALWPRIFGEKVIEYLITESPAEMAKANYFSP
jgi:hypothetical protein